MALALRGGRRSVSRIVLASRAGRPMAMADLTGSRWVSIAQTERAGSAGPGPAGSPDRSRPAGARRGSPQGAAQQLRGRQVQPGLAEPGEDTRLAGDCPVCAGFFGRGRARFRAVKCSSPPRRADPSAELAHRSRLDLLQHCIGDLALTSPRRRARTTTVRSTPVARRDSLFEFAAGVDVLALGPRAVPSAACHAR